MCVSDMPVRIIVYCIMCCLACFQNIIIFPQVPVPQHRHPKVMRKKFCGLLWYVCVSAVAWVVSQAAADTHIPQQTTELSSQL